MRYYVIQIDKILKSQQEQQELLIVGPRALALTRGQKSYDKDFFITSKIKAKDCLFSAF